jgi:hypothetical protein
MLIEGTFVVAEGPAALGPSSDRILPLRLSRQVLVLPRPLGEPLGVPPGIVPADIDHRMPTETETAVWGQPRPVEDANCAYSAKVTS